MAALHKVRPAVLHCILQKQNIAFSYVNIIMEIDFQKIC